MPTLDDSIKEIKRFKENLKEAAKTDDDVKNGIVTPEEEMKEPDFQIYDIIAETTIQILQNKRIVETFNKVSEKIGDELTKSIIEALSIAMTNSAFNAILWYDQMLEQEIVPQVNKLIEKVNGLDADVTGYSGAIRVLKEKVSELEKQKITEKLDK